MVLTALSSRAQVTSRWFSPMSRMPSGSVTRRFPLPRAAQVHQLLLSRCTATCSLLYTKFRVDSVLFKTRPAPRQDQVLQVHSGVLPSGEDEQSEEAGPGAPAHWRAWGRPPWSGQALCWERRWEAGGAAALALEVGGTGPGSLVPGHQGSLTGH